MTIATYNGQNQKCGYIYDPAGNVTYDNANQYLYDGEGRICAVYQIPIAGVGGQMTGYLYDAEGRRVAKGTIYSWTCDTTQNSFSLTNTYIIGPTGEQLTETDGSGNWLHTNVFSAGQMLATYSYTDSSHTATDTYFSFTDWLGTKRAVVSAGGCGTGYVSLPYGDSLTATNMPGFTQCPDVTEHHFTGKERDAESGLDYFGARYYASNMGRFMSPDPMLIMKQKMTDPQQWNMYSYVRNNPLRMVDTNGKWPTDIHNQIIDRAFPGLSAHQRDILKSASAGMDHCMTCQLESNSFQHSMRAPGQDPGQAKQEAADFVHTEEHLAQDVQATNGRNTNGNPTPSDVSDIKDGSLSLFGNAAHTVADGTSPAHVDAQGNPLPWDPYSPSGVEAHEAAESTITPEQMNNAVTALQGAFQTTYGQAAAQQAATPPPPPQQQKQPQ